MKLIEFLKGKKGATGIGTLIVFIAMVLVAAVAAAVLINTSGFLQQKAMATGKESTEQVASGLKIIGIKGCYNTSLIKQMVILVSPNAGSAPIDLSQVKIMISNGTKKLVLTYNSTYFTSETSGVANLFNTSLNAWNTTTGTLLPGKNFGIIVIQDADNSCSNSNTPVINKGDIVALTIDTALNGTNLGLPVRTKVVGSVIPEFGAPATFEFTTPATYVTIEGSDLGVVDLI
ncbi:flagellin [Methanocaldococcus sp. 10A]